ncbi:hypothetical protein [Paraburkholderia acidisoli]
MNAAQSTASNSAPTAAAPAAADLVGHDADAHGCRASAGYSWCEHTQRCERPWELAQRQHFTPGETQFARYCATGSAE